MSKKFNPNNPVQTRDGKCARIICVNREVKDDHSFPIVALIKSPTDVVERLECYRNDGSYTSTIKEHLLDLINLPTKRIGWINIFSSTELNYTYAGNNIYETKEQAESVFP